MANTPTLTIEGPLRKAFHRAILLVSVAVLWFGIAAPAQADVTFQSFRGSLADATGDRMLQAGAHPDYTTEVNASERNLESVLVDLPPGLVANPGAVPTCRVGDLGFGASTGKCAPEAQVGTVALIDGDAPNGGYVLPLFNLEPPEGVPALLGFKVYGVVTRIVPRVRPGEYAISADGTGISQTLPLTGVRVTVWGVPADPVHDAERARFGFIVSDGGGAASTAPRAAYFTAPTSCPGQALTTRAAVRSWNSPTFSFASFDSDFDGFPMIIEGCDRLGFAPSVAASPTTAAPDAPTGVDVHLNSPQNLRNPDGLANAQLRDVTATFPEGMTINPGSADGLQACTDQQLGLGNDQPVSCPDGSKIGTARASTPLLDETLQGALYVRTQNSDDPESGEMFRVALVIANKQRGILVKLPGSLVADRGTGRLTASFDNNPQLPVEDIDLVLKSGPRAPLVTPTTCGPKSIDTRLVSWAGHDVTLPSAFEVACAAGLGGFAPGFSAGSANSRAGAFAPFTVAITKPDGDSAIDGVSITMPTGLLAKLRGNVGSQVGTARAFAGSGSNPFMLPGKVYLEGRYDDAPFSLKVVVPAKAGPFDLGEVVVRQKIYVDPVDAHVTVVSDPLPTIVKGVPVRLQRLEVSVDKPSFTVNPTSCAPKSISGALHSVSGATAAPSVRFQVGDCSLLDLEPSLGLSLSGKGQTTDGKHPAVTATLTQPAGQANLKKVRVALPLSLALDPDNANGLCEFVDGSKATPTCPKASIVGTATAVTPILDEPLTGPVYFVKNIRKDPKSGREIRTLPKLVIPLVGQNGVKLTLTGTSAVEDDQLVTTFDNIPDAPVSSFKLNINGGKGGILTVSDADICKSTQIADQQIDGQNNKQADADVFIQTPSCPLKVLSKKVTAKAVTLKVGGLGAGKVTVTGKGVKKTSKSISKSTVATIVVKRTKGAPKQIKVSFLAKGAKKAKTARA